MRRARHAFAALAALAGAGCGSSHDLAPAGGGNPMESFASIAPKVGELAPDFTLVDSDGAQVRLFDALKRGPVALVFGSFS